MTEVGNQLIIVLSIVFIIFEYYHKSQYKNKAHGEISIPN